MATIKFESGTAQNMADKNIFVRLSDLGFTGAFSNRYIALSNLYILENGETKQATRDTFEKAIKRNGGVSFVYYDKANQEGEPHTSEVTSVKDTISLIYDTTHSATASGDVELFNLQNTKDVTNPTTNIKPDKYFSIQQPTKIGKRQVIKAKNFELRDDGVWVPVSLRGNRNTIMVSIYNLYKSVQQGDFSTQLVRLVDDPAHIEEALKTYRDQPLFIKEKSDSEPIATEPVARSLLMNRYAELKSMQPTSEVFGDDTYLRLNSGKYAKEKEAAHPLMYDYAGEKEKADAYLVTVKDNSGERQVIVKHLGRVRINGATYDFPAGKGIPLKRVKKRLYDGNCDVIQTTNEHLDDPIYECQVLRDREHKDLADKEDRLDKATTQFESLYKEKRYLIDSITTQDDNGKLYTEELLNDTRYKQTSEIVLNDVASRRRDSAYVGKNDLYFENGKLKGGQKFSAFKFVGDHSKVALDIVGVSAGLGLMSVLFSPVLPFVGLGIAAATFPTLLVAGLVQKIKIQGKGYRYKDKIKINRDAWTKSVNSDLKTVAENYRIQQNEIKRIKENQEIIKYVAGIRDFSKLSKEDKKMIKKYKKYVSDYNFKGKTHERINAEMNKQRKRLSAELEQKQTLISQPNFDHDIRQIEQKMASISSTTYSATSFEMKNGKGKVTKDNIVLFEEYKLRLKAMEKKLAQARGKDPQVYEDLRAQYAEMKRNYVVKATTVGATSEFRDLQERFETMRGFMAQKLYGTKAEQEKLKDYDYDVTTGKFLYKDKVVQHGKKGDAILKRAKEFRSYITPSQNIILPGPELKERQLKLKKPATAQETAEQTAGAKKKDERKATKAKMSDMQPIHIKNSVAEFDSYTAEQLGVTEAEEAEGVVKRGDKIYTWMVDPDNIKNLGWWADMSTIENVTPDKTL